MNPPSPSGLDEPDKNIRYPGGGGQNAFTIAMTVDLPYNHNKPTIQITKFDT